MAMIYVLYGADAAALQALADNRNATLIPGTVTPFDGLADDNDGSNGTNPVLAVGGRGVVALARVNG
ncbi:MAG: hypothetical protein WCO11_00245 [Sphingomonadales bacterium]|jgi:hypothetical protein